MEYILKELKNGQKIKVRDLQLEVLSIMDEVDRICRKNKIEYLLIAGSALGAINYKGFIPWDDDMDIAIPRKHWEKFIKAMKKDLKDDFYFQCYETDKKYNIIMGPTMKVRKKGTYIEEVNFLLANRCKSGDGIFLDVVVYDNVSDNVLVDQFFRTIVKILMPFYVLLDNLFINPIPLKKFILWLSEKYARMNEKSELVSQRISIPWEKFLKEPKFLKEDVYPLREYEFEGRKFYSYNNIEKVMKQWYGNQCCGSIEDDNWKETLPVEKRKPKHAVDVNFKGETPIEPAHLEYNKGYILGGILIFIGLILFRDISFVLIGLGIVSIGITMILKINNR